MAWFRISVNIWVPLVGTITVAQNVIGLRAGLFFLLWSIFSFRIYLWHKLSVCLLMPGISISVIDEFYSVSTPQSSGKYKEEILSNFILLVSIALHRQYNPHELCIKIKRKKTLFFSSWSSLIKTYRTYPKVLTWPQNSQPLVFLQMPEFYTKILVWIAFTSMAFPKSSLPKCSYTAIPPIWVFHYKWWTLNSPFQPKFFISNHPLQMVRSLSITL